MAISIGSRKGQTAEMNVTPLIDVLLVLIIIFMVVMPHHSLGEQADIPTPAKDSRVSGPERTIVVQLLDEGEGKLPGLKINGTDVAWEDLIAKMNTTLVLRGQRVVFLQSDPEVEFEYVAQALNLTRAAGADRIGLMSGHEAPLSE